MPIPFFDLHRQYQSIKSEVDDVIGKVFTRSQFTGGPAVSDFEKQFAKCIRATHCISTGNGTDALFLILKALDLPVGSEVIVPAWGCIASAEPVSLAGFKLVFCDVDPQFYTIDLQSAQKKITENTRAIIAVHLYGQAAPVMQLKALCDRYHLHLIEDCAQAHFTLENGKPVGNFGVAAAFSFYPTKNLGAYGDAGCVVTSQSDLAEKVRRLSNHGALHKNDHVLIGTNSRMDALQAAVLSVKLRHLEHWNKRRVDIASHYTEALSAIDGLTVPQVRPGTKHTFHIYCICTNRRDELKKYLVARGIETAVHYPLGLPFTQAYQHFKLTEADYPVTSSLQREVLSLPVFPELTSEEVTFICSGIQHFFSR
ncbi:DegT/DnrJ/EryC1/StrS family aminotransferase [Oscillatoria amoena NRMC-F 0135]|nr:DegT/DnrJ/EryC1/StrS family aminotransferase [Oscillatoria amoena NRMC-F 0135]